MKPLRVVVADDAALVREGIVRLLEDFGFSVVAQVGDGEALVSTVDTHEPDVVIADIRMPPTQRDEGLRAAAEIRQAHPHIGVLVLSQYVEPRSALALLDGRPGGAGYLLKERVTDIEDFTDAVRRIARGELVIDPLVAAKMLGRRQRGSVLDRLTPREREVLAFMAEGRSNHWIGNHLVLHSKTVETHVRAIFRKLDLVDSGQDHRRVQAVLQFLKEGD